MANEKTKVKAGKGLEWRLMMTDENGFLLGVHFDRHRKIGKAQMDILKAALWDAAEKLDDMEDSKRNRACAKHALTVKVGGGGTAPKGHNAELWGRAAVPHER